MPTEKDIYILYITGAAISHIYCLAWSGQEYHCVLGADEYIDLINIYRFFEQYRARSERASIDT